MDQVVLEKKNQVEEMKLAKECTPPVMKKVEHQKNKRGMQGRKKKKRPSRVASIPMEGCGKFSSFLYSSLKMIVNALERLLSNDWDKIHIHDSP